jgi:hypothetical protein
MEGYDGVEPSGNSSAAMAFLRLHALGVRESFDQDALRILAGYAQHLPKAGVSFSAMLSALSFHLGPPKEVAVVGNPKANETQALLKVLRERFLPDTVVAAADPDMAAVLGKRIPLLASRTAAGNRASAYVCRNMTCQLPVHTPQDLTALLAGK